METLQERKEVTARKDHECDFCCDKIRKGKPYLTAVYAQDGEIYTWKTHIKCQDLATRMKMYDNEEGVCTEENFINHVADKYDQIILGRFNSWTDDILKNIAREISYINFRRKLNLVIRHFAIEDKNKQNDN